MKGQILKPLVVATLCLLTAVGCVSSPQPAAPTPTPPPPSPAPSLDPRMALAQSFQDGLNRGDGAAVAALFVDEGLGYMDSGYLINDKAGVAEYIEEGAPRHWNLQLSECAAQGAQWHCRAVEREDCMQAGTGMDELRTDMTLTPRDGKIEYIEFKPTVEVGAAIKKAEEAFWTWVQAERPADWQKIATPETAPTGRAQGELLAKLCAEYMAAH
jgi:hypothetical protein